jgi:outer membrane lipoprotein carrier protein
MMDKKLRRNLLLHAKDKESDSKKRISNIQYPTSNILVIGLIILLSFLLTSVTNAAPTYTLPEILQHMEETQKKVDSFRARFLQTKTIYLLEGAVKSEGELYFQRPGRLYWETKDPNRLVVVMNDNTLWLYYPDLKAADKLDITLLRGLINKYVGLGQSLEALKAQYDIKLAEVGPQVIILDLFPKTPRLRAQIKRLRLWVNTKNWFPQEVENVEANGDRTHIVFSSFDLNITIPAGRFTFTPPRGVKMKDLGSLEVPQ